MADQKISQLTDGGNAQATDEYVIARSGANYRIDGASVAAAATSVGTLTSLTVSGDLTVDTSTLKVDSANNRVGVGTTSPATALDVAGATARIGSGVSTADASLGIGENRSGNGYAYVDLVGDTTYPDYGLRLIRGNTGANAYSYLQHRGTGDVGIYAQDAASVVFGTQATERMRLDASGNAGLGVTPSAWVAGARAVQLDAYSSLFESVVGKTTLAFNAYESASNTYKYLQNEYATMYQQVSGVHSWYTAASGTAGNAITFTQAMTLDASGNLGVGTTSPSTFGKLATLATSTATAFYAGTTTQGLYLSVDDSTKLVTYASSGTNAGGHRWNIGNTEAARITTGGYFKASDAGTYVSSTGSYHELRNSANEPAVNLGNTNGSFTGALLYGNTSKAASGTFNLISMNSNAVQQFAVTGDGVIYAQNTTVQSLSDARLKENIADATDGLSVITALRPVRYDWKAGYGNDRKHQLGFIAQEVETVFPEAVSEWVMDEPTGEVDEDGKPITEKATYKTVGPGALIPVLVKAIQELEARIAVLEAGA